MQRLLKTSGLAKVDRKGLVVVWIANTDAESCVW
jgi:hypothetical protein